MWKSSTQTGILLILSGFLVWGSAGCASNTAENSPSPAVSSSSPAGTPASVPKTKPPKSKTPGSPKTAASPAQTPSEKSDAYDRAMDAANGAVNISKSAVSRDDWKLVASYWQQAIDLLKQVPTSSPQRANAVKKIPQYQRFLAEAKEKAAPPLNKTAQGDLNPQYFSIPIKGRRKGTPIVEVNFNGSRTFEMLFDTGATVTLITRSMTYSLGLKPDGVTQVGVADGSIVGVHKTTLKSMEIDGRIKRNISVVVAPPAMEEGLLGQDFYEGYDVAIKENIIEFRRR
jgi:predicted aspartyl protease